MKNCMFFLFPLFHIAGGLFMAMSLVALPKIAQSQVSMNLSQSVVSTVVGDKFSLAVEVQNFDQQPVDLGEVHLNFDPNALQVTQLTAFDVPFPVEIISPTFDNTSGTIDYAAGTFGNFSTEDFTLLIIEFQAIRRVVGSQITFNTSFPRESIVTYNGTNVLSGGLATTSVNVQNPTLACEDIVIFDGEVLTSTPFILRANTAIILKPGFVAENGRVFEAKIGDCLDAFSSNAKVANTSANSTTTSLQNPANSIPREMPELVLSIQPNPAKVSAEICVRTATAAKTPLLINVVNSTGQLVRQYEKEDLAAEEQYCISVPTQQLPNGMYYIQLVTKSVNRVEKLLVVD